MAFIYFLIYCYSLEHYVQKQCNHDEIKIRANDDQMVVLMNVGAGFALKKRWMISVMCKNL